MSIALAVPRRPDLLARLGIKSLAGRQAALGYAIVGLVYLFFAIFVFGPITLPSYFRSWSGMVCAI
jgi:ABC-type multidrug transport system permease subunit